MAQQTCQGTPLPAKLKANDSRLSVGRLADSHPPPRLLFLIHPSTLRRQLMKLKRVLPRRRSSANFNLMAGMLSSHTVNVEDLILGPLQTISTCFERSASLDERNTLMEVLISMLSSISEDVFDPDEPTSLMYQATIQTYRHLSELRRVDGTMQSRMVTLSLEGLQGRAEWELLRIARSGMKSRTLRMMELFGSVLYGWIRKRSLRPTPTSTSSPNGDTLRLPGDTRIHLGSNLSWEWYQSWIAGENSVLEQIDLEVNGSPAYAYSGEPSPERPRGRGL